MVPDDATRRPPIAPTRRPGSGYLERMAKGNVGKAVVVIGAGAKIAVKYGPQAKIAWDKGGKQAAAAATRGRSRSPPGARRSPTRQGRSRLGAQDRARRQDGVRRVQRRAADRGVPHQDAPFPALLAHVDLGKRVPAEKKAPSRREESGSSSARAARSVTDEPTNTFVEGDNLDVLPPWSRAASTSSTSTRRTTPATTSPTATSTAPAATGTRPGPR